MSSNRRPSTSGSSNNNLAIPGSSSPRAGSPLSAASGVYGSPSVPQIPSRSESNTPFANSPRTGSPFQRRAAEAAAPASADTQPGPVASSSASSLSAQQPPARADTPLTEAQKAEIVRRHLLSAEDQSRVAAQEQLASASSASNIALSSAASITSSTAQDTPTGPTGLDEQYPTPYHLEGGDVVAGVYKWASQAAAQGSGATSLRRSKSMETLDLPTSRRASMAPGEGRPDFAMSSVDVGEEAVGEEEEGDSGMRVRDILEPGGFRRDFVNRKRSDTDLPSIPGSQRDFGAEGGAARGGNGGRATRSFIDFLSLYGHFGGEDLEEIEEEDEEAEEDEEDQVEGLDIPPFQREVSERTPLVRGRSHGRSGAQVGRKRSSSVGDHGDATVTQAVFMLLKSFVGTGVLFLGKAFYNGGILFSTIVLCFIAMISLYSFLLLVETRLVVHGSFGDIGGILYGKYMRWMILFSIVLSQVGFVAAYTIFVSQNLQAFVMAVTNCATYVPIQYLILAQLVIFLPLAMIRNIQKLSGTALVADAFILFGLVYIFSNEISVLKDVGMAKVALFNPKDFPLLIGTAVFSFEGIGLVIPITESMKDPHRFPPVLTGVMIGVMVLFAGGGALGYATYGKDIQTVVFVNLPQDDKFVNAAQFLYSIAILLSTPLQLFPAVRIMENGIFSRSGKHSTKVKWEKNMFRMLVVVGCSIVAWAGASDLDKFVSLIGSLACVPLCFCYPAMLHYKACATTRKQKVLDGALFVFGLVAALYTTSQTIILLASGGESAPPTFGKCPPRT